MKKKVHFADDTKFNEKQNNFVPKVKKFTDKFVMKLFESLPLNEFLQNFENYEMDMTRILSSDDYSPLVYAASNQKTEKLEYLFKIGAYPSTEKKLESFVKNFIIGLILEEECYNAIKDEYYDGFNVFLSMDKNAVKNVMNVGKICSSPIPDSINKAFTNKLKEFENKSDHFDSNNHTSEETTKSELALNEDSCNKNASYNIDDNTTKVRYIKKNDDTDTNTSTLTSEAEVLLDILDKLYENGVRKDFHLVQRLMDMLKVLEKQNASIEDRVMRYMEDLLNTDKTNAAEESAISQHSKSLLYGLNDDTLPTKYVEQELVSIPAESIISGVLVPTFSHYTFYLPTFELESNVSEISFLHDSSVEYNAYHSELVIF